MAKIVLAMATTHGPQLHTTVEQWQLRVKADKGRKHPFRNGVYSFDELVDMRRAEGLDAKSSMDAQTGYHARCHAAMEVLADKWEAVGADVAVILGNDQDEIYKTGELNPAFMVFFGDTIPSYPQSEEDKAKLPPGVAEAEHGHAAEEYKEYRGVPDLGMHIIKTLTEHDFDVAASKVWPAHARNGASHAFGHIYRQVMRDNVVPNVPVYQNTFFPPNQPIGEARVSIRPDRQAGDRVLGVRQARRGVRLRRHEPFRDRRGVRPQIRRRAEKARQEFPHLDPAQGAAVGNVGAEILDIARRPARELVGRHERDRLRPVLSFAGRHRHRERLLLVGSATQLSLVSRTRVSASRDPAQTILSFAILALDPGSRSAIARRRRA